MHIIQVNLSYNFEIITTETKEQLLFYTGNENHMKVIHDKKGDTEQREQTHSPQLSKYFPFPTSAKKSS